MNSNNCNLKKIKSENVNITNNDEDHELLNFLKTELTTAFIVMQDILNRVTILEEKLGISSEFNQNVNVIDSNENNNVPANGDPIINKNIGCYINPPLRQPKRVKLSNKVV